jgi:hypothetical protein
MFGADKIVPSRVNETSVDRAPRLMKSGKFIGTAHSHRLTGQGSETVALVKRSRVAPPKDRDVQSPERGSLTSLQRTSLDIKLEKTVCLISLDLLDMDFFFLEVSTFPWVKGRCTEDCARALLHLSKTA